MGMRIMIRRTLAALLLAGVAAMALAQPASTQKPRQLKVGAVPAGALGLVFLADIYGYYREEGLDVEVITFRAGADVITAGMSGSLDIITGGVEHPATLFERGAPPWKSIAGLLSTSPFSIVSRTGVDIKPADFAALKGRRIGTPGVGRSAHMVISALLKEAGLDAAKDVTFFEIPSGAPGVSAFERSGVDAAIVNEPVTSALLARNAARMFADLSTGKFGPVSTFPQAVAIASQRLIDLDRPSLERFVRAVCRAGKRGSANAEEAADLLVRRFGGASTPAAAEELKVGLRKFASGWGNIELPAAPIEAWFKVLVENGALKKPTSYDSVVDAKFRGQWKC